MTALTCFSIILALSSVVRGDDESFRTNLRIATSTNNDKRNLQLLGHGGKTIENLWDTIDSTIQNDIFDGMSMPLSDLPSSSPVMLSDAPSGKLSEPPSIVPSKVPGTNAPVTKSPVVVSKAPTIKSTVVPTVAPLAQPVKSPTIAPTSSAIDSPSTSPETLSGAPVTLAPTTVPTITNCIGLSADERIENILAILDKVADSDLIRDNSSPQGRATTWLLDDDELQVCPSEDACAMIQRWTLAVVYFSTGGDDWFQCSSTYENTPTDNCGAEVPFENDQRFLSNTTECNWAGIACNDTCVSEMIFEENNLAGRLPTEIGLLANLEVWGMERGNLTGPIPTEIGLLQKLIFLDLDFNQLTGTLSSELLSLRSLTQLDLNDNLFTGSIAGLDSFPFIEFLQIHRNDFTGTVPEGIGAYSRMAAFTLHETLISGTMPSSVCDLVQINAPDGKVLTSLIADCADPNPDIVCDCCTDCRSPN